jgi:glycosyltransferase involved in cell wall biosynthesis
MKVAFLTGDNREAFKDYSAAMPYFGTAPEAVLQGFAHLPDLEVHVVTCTQKPMKSPEKIADNIWFHSLYVPKVGWMRTSYQGCIRAIRRRLKVIKPDIVHGQGSERECAVAAVFSRLPNVLTIHGNMAELARLFNARMGTFSWLAGQLENIALGRAIGVFCNSEYTEGLVKPRARRTWRVANPLREEFFTAPVASPTPGKCILVNIGVISERKRQIELLDVARRLHAQGLPFEFQFIGLAAPGDAYSERFLENLKDGVAKGYASHSGFMGTVELMQRIDAAHGLVHFPSEEAFGLVVAEAMARGLQFFGSRLGGIVDISRDVPGAELFAADDWDGLANGLATWIRAGYQRPAGAAEIMRERYHPSVIARRHVEIYQEALRTDSKAP